MQGVELDDFVSGPRELLLKLVEEHYPLPPEPNHPGGWHFSSVIQCRGIDLLHDPLLSILTRKRLPAVLSSPVELKFVYIYFY